jgi:membrane-bound ClpP family serine protease
VPTIKNPSVKALALRKNSLSCPRTWEPRLKSFHMTDPGAGTNLGAATPVQIDSPIPGLPSTAPDKYSKGRKDNAARPKGAMVAKITNDIVAFIRSPAELRGCNADWPKKPFVKPRACP